MNYEYQPKVARLEFSEACAELQRRGHAVHLHGIDNISPPVVERILQQAMEVGAQFDPYAIDIADYCAWFTAAGYAKRYPKYYADNRVEKSLEHYLAFRLLDVGRNDVFVDLAAEHSPAAEIFGRLTGATCYAQDIMYPPGLSGNRIGGDACAMPVTDAKFSKALLACSLEHFEESADTRLFLELARVLQPGGSVVVVPFYVFTTASTQTDPCLAVPANVRFDPDTPLYCAQGWGNRHGRFYSPESFVSRIMAPVADRFRFEFFHLANAADVDRSVYARFAFKATRI